MSYIDNHTNYLHSYFILAVRSIYIYIHKTTTLCIVPVHHRRYIYIPTMHIGVKRCKKESLGLSRTSNSIGYVLLWVFFRICSCRHVTKSLIGLVGSCTRTILY
ncbi:hypothetical protein ACP275_08G180900 [Erythranthe tilingii]